MRLFVGFILPKELQTKISKFQEELKLLPMNAKFVERENLHVNFSFLGRVEEDKLTKLNAKLKKIAERYVKFKVATGKVLLIPSKKFIRVIALDFGEGKDWLAKISRDVVAEVGGDAKPPHLTLCRVRYVANKQRLAERVERIDRRFELLINSIQLIKSELSREGPTYRILAEFKLKD